MRRWTFVALALLALTAVVAVAARPQRPRCAVVLGASIAAGYRAAPGSNWPALVARDMAHDPQACLRDRSVSATRLLLTMPGLPSYLDREPAALGEPHVTDIVLTDLINDIQALPHQYDPRAVLAGIHRFVAAAHRRGVRVLATTITPYGGYHYTGEQRYTAAGERCRRDVNTALRRGRLVDGVIDFDRALADPADPARLRPGYDSGDHLHPSTAGQQAMASVATAVLRR